MSPPDDATSSSSDSESVESSPERPKKQQKPSVLLTEKVRQQKKKNESERSSSYSSSSSSGSASPPPKKPIPASPSAPAVKSRRRSPSPPSFQRKRHDSSVSPQPAVNRRRRTSPMQVDRSPPPANDRRRRESPAGRWVASPSPVRGGSRQASSGDRNSGRSERDRDRLQKPRLSSSQSPPPPRGRHTSLSPEQPKRVEKRSRGQQNVVPVNRRQDHSPESPPKTKKARKPSESPEVKKQESSQSDSESSEEEGKRGRNVPAITKQVTRDDRNSRPVQSPRRQTKFDRKRSFSSSSSDGEIKKEVSHAGDESKNKKSKRSSFSSSPESRLPVREKGDAEIEKDGHRRLFVVKKDDKSAVFARRNQDQDRRSPIENGDSPRAPKAEVSKSASESEVSLSQNYEFQYI